MRYIQIVLLTVLLFSTKVHSDSCYTLPDNDLFKARSIYRIVSGINSNQNETVAVFGYFSIKDRKIMLYTDMASKNSQVEENAVQILVDANLLEQAQAFDGDYARVSGRLLNFEGKPAIDDVFFLDFVGNRSFVFNEVNGSTELKVYPLCKTDIETK
ncbi:hypothetical protein [Thalassotalea mangrovi]|uniref:Uncharacterized protein n=1 Tax=Thalassotalea mangrovi TaxID=2572245 RepID=A0A4U1B7D9_9GAMM|nr:hypothetical protein [Thalassotalea mangrovi]TKB46431.1 hypothetical protein E8M12_05080 [Thalassotalea mangrovi]